MSKVIVSGGAGFIGSWLCEHLVNKGFEVLCIDNCSTGSEENIMHLKKSPLFRFARRDVSMWCGEGEKADIVFHLASPASPVDYQRIPVKTMVANSQGTQNLLEVAKNSGAVFVLASTSEVYGDPLISPQPETYWGNVNPIGIRSCYDESKRYAEALSMAYHRQFGVDVRIARIFNTYGKRMRRSDGRVIPNFINQALEGEDITVYGNGSQTRSFCHVSDTVEGLFLIATKRGISGEVFNIGNPAEHTILYLANLVKKLTGSNSKVVFCPLPEDDPKQRRPDISKAEGILGWKPVVDLEHGLRELVEYFREKHGSF